MKVTVMTLAAAGVAAALAVPAPNAALQARLDAEDDVIGIVHWGLNTFTDREWGYGDEDPKLLDPPKFDADQIVRACADGGIRGLVIVAKHHDGFCLWPTKTTPHNISASPFRGGRGDYVREMADACRRAGVRFGVYCSPWDRNNAAYSTDAYVETFHAQVTELLSNYGEVFEMWFDGANGGDGYYGGAREKRKIPGDSYYRFGELFKTVRRLQPKVTIFGMGGEYAWPGNERGVVDPGKSPCTEELYRMWEADFPLRKGWFHHDRESGTVRGGEFLMKIYLRSVGHGGTMNIGIAPDRDGLLPPEDVAALRRFREVKDAFFAHPVKDGPFNVVVTKNAYGVKRILKTGDPSVAGARYLVDEALMRRIDEATGPDGETDTARWMTGSAIPRVSYTTSWIANDGGWEETHVPHDMLDMFVRADGTVATICGWDEGGSNVAVYRGGRMVSRPEGSGTGGWGRMSGKQVVMDGKYVYQLLTQHGRDGGNDKLNDNGVRQFPPNDPAKEWKTIRRYDLETGKGAPFPGGFGYRGDMIVVCDEQPRSLEGLAIGDGRLYVSVTALPGSGRPDEVVVYDTARMERVGGFELTRPAGKLAADDRGGLWLMSAGEIVRLDAKTGRPSGPSLKIPSGVTAISFGLDLPRGRLLLPNRGKDLNVLVFGDIYRKPRLVETLGVKGGVFASDAKHLSGAAGTLRFSGPAGAGVDAAGNFYVCNTTVSGGRGTSLEAYGKDRRLLWKREGLVFTATADVSSARPNVLYTPEKIHAISESRAGGRLDELVAYTADPFRFPEDERVRPNGPFVTSTFKRTIGGRQFLFVSDMYGSMLAGYRFDAARFGYVGIPCVTFGGGAHDRPMTLWIDGDGDGRPQDSETRTFPQVNPYAMSFFVDDDGNVWRGVREQGVLCWKFRGLDAHGVPAYDEPVRFALPEGMRDAKRVWYDAARRELFIGGFSHARPDTKDTWWCMGSTIARCADPLAKGALKSDLEFYVPFNVEDGSGRDHTNAKAFCVAGDYVFVSLARNGRVDIYRRDTGASVGRLEPGEAVHRQSGWSDFNYCINACRLADGRYLVLNEENGFAKVMAYHVTFAAE